MSTVRQGSSDETDLLALQRRIPLVLQISPGRSRGTDTSETTPVGGSRPGGLGSSDVVALGCCTSSSGGCPDST